MITAQDTTRVDHLLFSSVRRQVTQTAVDQVWEPIRAQVTTRHSPASMGIFVGAVTQLGAMRAIWDAMTA